MPPGNLVSNKLSNSRPERAAISKDITRGAGYLLTVKSEKRKWAEKELQEVKKALLHSTFKFSSMYRSWIPKPNKLGELRAITKPDKAE